MTLSEPSSPPLAHKIAYWAFRFLKEKSIRASSTTLQRYETLFYWVFYYILRVCRPITKTNLKLAFPHKSEQERHALTKKHYRWFATLVFDILRMDSWKGHVSDYVTVQNIDVLKEALSENKGALLVGGHFGHWEFIGPAIVDQGIPIEIYTGEQSNSLVGTQQDQIRESFGIHTIPKSKTAPIALMKALRNNHVVAMLVDQNDRKSDLFVDFFGTPASMSPGVAAFHLMRQSPIVLTYPMRVGQKIVLSFERVSVQLTGDKEADTQIISQKITSALEAKIQEYPEQYLWMHKRWRSRPNHDPQPIY